MTMEQTSVNKVEEMAQDYAAYATVDMDAELKNIYESVEEMQLRLEEFTSILGMVQANSDKSIQKNLSRFIALRPQVNNLCKRIDALDFFVSKANLDLATLEANMEVAESSVSSSENKFAILNPFSFFKKTSEATANTPSPAANQPPQIFKIDDYFKSDA